MNDSRNESALRIGLDGPNVDSAAKLPGLDPGTAEVLRAIQQAKGAGTKTAAVGSAGTADLANEIRTLRAVLASCSPSVQDAEQSLTSRARVLEGALAAVTDKLTEFQRGEGRAVRELRDSMQALKQEANTLAAWHAWTTRRVAACGVVLAVLASAGLGLSWRAHQTARRTQAVLEQILENQAAAQADAQAGRVATRAKRVR